MKRVNRKEAPEGMLAFSSFNACKGCYYHHDSFGDCSRPDGKVSCSSLFREDNQDVIFIKKAPPLPVLNEDGVNEQDAPKGYKAAKIGTCCEFCDFNSIPGEPFQGGCNRMKETRLDEWNISCAGNKRKDKKSVIFLKLD